ncbi:TetR/AcrR family transcriptional regulator [Mycobacterium spongiae]|uniref:TetR/AcrR family transcriptional regulator n=1 Tax=Mycobacterium spongiae TaxID=886343 RepID=UPI001BA58CB4|nr:TetR/AcrR family transcriptional regulator [Mycobacterium spongiae]
MEVNLVNVTRNNLRTRDRLIDSAAQHFAEFGLDGASLRQIALDSEITPAAVYNHFPGGKMELYAAVMTIVADALGDLAIGKIDDPDRPVEVILQSAEQLWRFFERHPDIAKLLAREAIAHEENARDYFESCLESAKAIEVFLITAIEAKKVRPVEPKFFLMWTASVLINFHGKPMLRNFLYRDLPNDVALKHLLEQVDRELRLP